MFTVFKCHKCGHFLYVQEQEDFGALLKEVAGSCCPACGEQDEGLWGLLGRAEKYKGRIETIWEEPGEDYDE